MGSPTPPKFLLLVLALTVGAGCATEPSFPDEIALATRTVLAAPHELEVLALHPFPHHADGAPTDGADFHGYRVLGRAEVASAASRRELLGLVAAGLEASEGIVAACFDPRHGFRVRRGEEVVDLVICFECLSLQLFGPGELRDSLPIHDAPGAELTRRFEALGLTIHRGD